MDTVGLLAQFSDPGTIQNLSLMERLTAGFVTTILGMGITFVALVVLQFVVSMMTYLSKEKQTVTESLGVEKSHGRGEPADRDEAEENEELVAVISIVLALQMKTSADNIVIRNVEKVEESSNAWRKAGLAEQMDNAL